MIIGVWEKNELVSGTELVNNRICYVGQFRSGKKHGPGASFDE
jgi:hypothetical protein